MDIHLTPLEIQAFIEDGLDRKHWERILEHLDHCGDVREAAGGCGAEGGVRPIVPHS